MYAIASNEFGYSIYVETGGGITDNRESAFTTSSEADAKTQAGIYTVRAGYKFEVIEL